MKVIRIDDKIHEQLKKEAAREGRTIQWLVEKKLSDAGDVCIEKHQEPTLVADSQEWESPLPKDNLAGGMY